MDKQFLSHIAMENYDNICYMADIETYELIYLNRAIYSDLGIHPEQYQGRKCYEVLQGKDTVCSFCTNERLVKGTFYKWDHYNPLVDRHFALNDTLIELEGRSVRLEFGMDITERQKDKLKLQDKLLQEKILVKCLQVLSNQADTPNAIQSLLSIVREYHDADRSYIFEVSEDGVTMDNTYECNRDGVEPQIVSLQGVLTIYAKAWFERFEEKGDFYITSLIDDVDYDTEAYKILEPQGIKSLIAAPFKIDERVSGFIGVDNPALNIQDTSLLRSVALYTMESLAKKRKLDDKIEKLNYIDGLTGLQNRLKYMQTTSEIANLLNQEVGIVSMDINGMKRANEKYGQDYGDELILGTVELLQVQFPTHAYRIGGDEFIAFYIGHDRNAFNASVLNLRDSIKSQPHLNLSLGSTWCSDACNIVQQIAYAEELMHIDKQNYYNDFRSKKTTYRANLAADLIKAIELNQFTVLLQPKVLLENGHVVGAEILARKKNKKGGLISPDNFIPLYEAGGVIRYLDFYVLETACKLLQTWKMKGYTLSPISINFSRITIIEYNVANSIKRICDKYDIAPHLIIIELTEHISNIDSKALAEILGAIKSEGFKISLDDFGSEYSNLAVLTSMDFDEIKIDKSLVCYIASSSKSCNVLKSIIGMCNGFDNTETVAEGIETYEQLEILRANNCLVGQGYYFSKPISAEAFLHYYLQHS